jgi:hypothetical protein
MKIKILTVFTLLTFVQISFACPPGGCGYSELICQYDASPQGFKYRIEKNYHPNGQFNKNFLTIQQVYPKYYTHSAPPGAQISCSATGFGPIGSCKLGTQNVGSLNGGLFNNGKGFARDALLVGAPIDGVVYVIKNHALLGPKYNGGGYTTEYQSSSCLNFTAIAGRLNMPSPNRPPNMGVVPVVNSASQIWMDHSFIQNYSGPSYSDTPPDFNHSGMDPEFLSAYLQGVVNDNWSDYALLRLKTNLYQDINLALDTYSREEIINLAEKYNAMGMGSAFLTGYQDTIHGGFNFQTLPIGDATLSYLPEDDGVILMPRPAVVNAYNMMIKAIGQISGNALTAKSIYPSNLYDPPKLMPWYKGKSVHPGSYGPGTQYYSHDPLADICVPGSPDYIPAAFLNTVVLEELRHDWRFLTQKNIIDLKNKYKIEFWEQSYTSYMRPVELDNGKYLDVEACTLVRDDSINGCYESIVSEREMEGLSTDHIIRPELPLQTMPVDGNPNLNTASSSKVVKKKIMLSTLKPKTKWKPKHKTDAYYDDLVNNKLIIMNPEWSAKACIPKDTGSVNSNVEIVKPLKPILKKPSAKEIKTIEQKNNIKSKKIIRKVKKDVRKAKM